MEDVTHEEATQRGDRAHDQNVYTTPAAAEALSREQDAPTLSTLSSTPLSKFMGGEKEEAIQKGGFKWW